MKYKQTDTEYSTPTIEISVFYAEDIILSGSNGVDAGEMEEIDW